jgi:hypothetical protein
LSGALPPAAGDDRSPSPGGPASDSADADRTGRILLYCVAVGFTAGIAVLVYAIRLDWT